MMQPVIKDVISFVNKNINGKIPSIQWTYDSIYGWMRLLLDVDGNPIRDIEGKYVYVKI